MNDLNKTIQRPAWNWLLLELKTLDIRINHQKALGLATLYFLLMMVTVLLRALLTGSTTFTAWQTLLHWTWIDIDRKAPIIIVSCASGRISHFTTQILLRYIYLGPNVSEMFIPNLKRLLRSVLLDTPKCRAAIFQFWKTSNSLSISSLDIIFLSLPIVPSSWTGYCVPWISRI